VAGLAAAAALGEAELPVLVVEARKRIGGRVYTQQDPALHAPIDFGAEFIHGRPSEIWNLVDRSTVDEVKGQNWCAGPRGVQRCKLFSQVDKILEAMDDSVPDESFLDFLDRKFPNPSHDPALEDAKRRAVGYVSGFNAADPALVGVHWLVASMRAEQKIDGERAFRCRQGYTALLDAFRKRIARSNVTIRTGVAVNKISWAKGKARVTVRDRQGTSTLVAPQVLITLPLAVLQASSEAGAIDFAPALPRKKIVAMSKLEMGKVIRIVLRFRRRFWNSIPNPGARKAGRKKDLSDMSFLFSDDDLFPTWWTSLPQKRPFITGWAPFRSAEKLSGQPESTVIKHAVETLSRLLGVEAGKVENWLDAAYLHDWQTDPFSRGAYSYAKVGADGAQQALGAPVENTLFFAGEATDTSGNNGTVHGAIASGYRAAQEIIEARRG